MFAWNVNSITSTLAKKPLLIIVDVYIFSQQLYFTSPHHFLQVDFLRHWYLVMFDIIFMPLHNENSVIHDYELVRSDLPLQNDKGSFIFYKHCFLSLF